jgi:hypothetical protein
LNGSNDGRIGPRIVRLVCGVILHKHCINELKQLTKFVGSY